MTQQPWVVMKNQIELGPAQDPKGLGPESPDTRRITIRSCAGPKGVGDGFVSRPNRVGVWVRSRT